MLLFHIMYPFINRHYWNLLGFESYGRCHNTPNDDETDLIPALEFFFLCLHSLIPEWKRFIVSVFCAGQCTRYFTYAVAFNLPNNLYSNIDTILFEITVPTF